MTQWREMHDRAIPLQFTISNKAVSAPIPGAKSPEQALANAAAGVSELTEEEMILINSIVAPGADAREP